jgi:hypothetical protein
MSKISGVKIAIDIRRITEFGVGTYTRNIIRALARLDHENEYFLLGSPQKASEIGVLPGKPPKAFSSATRSWRGWDANWSMCRTCSGCHIISRVRMSSPFTMFSTTCTERATALASSDRCISS